MEDYIVRATAADAQIRAFACTDAGVAEAARQAHNTSPVITAALGRLLSAGAMMGSMMKGERDILTLQIKGDGPVHGLTVTAGSDGNVKGYADVPDVVIPASSAGKLDVGGAVGKGTLSVIRDMGLKEPYVGQTMLQTGEIAEDLAYYYAVSEQIPSCVGLGVLMERNNTVKQSGGFILQMMPFAEEQVVERLERNLQNVKPVTAMLESGCSPENMLEILLDGLELKVTDTLPIRFYCGCGREKIEKVLLSLGAKELKSMIDEGKETEVCCSFCGRRYRFDTQELEMLYQKGIGSGSASGT